MFGSGGLEQWEHIPGVRNYIAGAGNYKTGFNWDLWRVRGYNDGSLGATPPPEYVKLYWFAMGRYQ
jgi:hypothetical protein